jgi:hypothetical protein
MQVYFDESGDFRPITVGTEKFCFVLGVMVPETAIDGLKTSVVTSKPANGGQGKCGQWKGPGT